MVLLVVLAVFLAGAIAERAVVAQLRRNPSLARHALFRPRGVRPSGPGGKYTRAERFRAAAVSLAGALVAVVVMLVVVRVAESLGTREWDWHALVVAAVLLVLALLATASALFHLGHARAAPRSFPSGEASASVEANAAATSTAEESVTPEAATRRTQAGPMIASALLGGIVIALLFGRSSTDGSFSTSGALGGFLMGVAIGGSIGGAAQAAGALGRRVTRRDR